MEYAARPASIALGGLRRLAPRPIGVARYAVFDIDLAFGWLTIYTVWRAGPTSVSFLAIVLSGFANGVGRSQPQGR